MRTTVILILLLFVTLCSSAQSNPDSIGWADFESAILSGKNLEDTRSEISQVKTTAIKRNDELSVARSLYLLMQIDDRKTEDSFFFFNARFIDSTLNVTPSPKLTAVMSLLKAKRLRSFRNKFAERASGRRFKYSNTFEYGKLNPGQLDSLSDVYFDRAISLAPALENEDISRLLWLSMDPLIFLYKAKFIDIVYAEKILSANNSSPLISAEVSQRILALSSGELFDRPDLFADLPSMHKRISAIFKEWASVYHERDIQVYSFIEMKTRQQLFNASFADPAVTKIYESYLEQQLLSPYGALKALAVVQLVNKWVDQAKRYNSGFNNYYEVPSRDTSVRLYNVKAYNLIKQYRPQLDSFGYIQARLDQLEESILEKQAVWGANKQQLPGEPILTYLRYRNIRQLYVRIVRVRDGSSRGNVRNGTLFKDGFFHDTVYQLPDPEDYQLHNTYLKIGGLLPGKYTVFYSGKPFQIQDTTGSFSLSVSNIAVLNNDEHVFVLNRKTGFPFEDAKVLIDGKQVKLNSSGYLIVKDPDAEIEVIAGNDSISTFPNDPDNTLPDKVYSKDDYDDLMEYYEDNIEIRFFTDRAIYRPGQTVYYKGIFTIPDTRTGEERVLNWQNLKFSFVKKMLYKLSLKFKKRKVNIQVSDAFGNDVETLKVWPDKFGAVAGSFVLPKNAATGEWDFDSEDLDVSASNNGSFRVEEYKRPSFEVIISKPVTELALGDDFPITMRVHSFAGSTLEHVLIKYSVVATGQIPQTDGSWRSRKDTLMSATGTTDGKGEFSLKLSDSSFFKNMLIPDGKVVNINYNVDVQAIDNTGESQEAEAAINLSSRPVVIKARIPEMIDLAELIPYYIAATSVFAGELKKEVAVKISRIPAKAKPHPALTTWFDADTWIYPVKQLQDWFTNVDFNTWQDDIQDEHNTPVYETTINTGSDEKLQLAEAALDPGSYSIEITCSENGKITGKFEKNFMVFDSKERLAPEDADAFHYLPVNSIPEGQTLSWFSGADRKVFSIYHVSYYEKGKKKMQIKNVYELRTEEKGLNEWKYLIPPNVSGNIVLTHQYLKDNHLYFQQQFVSIARDNSSMPELVVEKYRTKLMPGEKEVFNVSFCTKDIKQAAQLMTTMYDASLDKLKKKDWRVYSLNNTSSVHTSWDRSVNSRSTGRMLEKDRQDSIRDPRKKAVWWSEVSLSDDIASPFSGVYRAGFSQALQGRAAGVSVDIGSGWSNLNEVVIVGYGTQRKSEVTGAIRIRGTTSLNGYSNMLVVLDGVMMETDLSRLDVNTITDGVVLQGADAAAIYGSRAANGVLILSTKGAVQMPVPAKEPVATRTNFSETAFFYPRILADKKGWFTINFTLPESVTTWKWKMLAHTKKAEFTYAEKTVYSQLPMMVQPDMPRFLYQGDAVVLKSRISNLDSNDITGVVKCVIEDLVTGNDLSAQLLAASRQPFTVNASANSVASFRIVIPDTLIHPLRIRVIASGKNLSDGEEHIVPILSPKTLVTESVPLQAGAVQSTPNLPADATPYGVSAYIQPKASAALLNALPYLAAYPYNCTEQTFNKLLAHSVATKVMRTNTVLQQAYDRHLKNAAPDATAADSLTDGRGESMPWLQMEFATMRHQRQLFGVLDTMTGRQKIEEYMNVIKDNQQADGGMSWFKGGKSNPYISFYLLAGLGKMNHDSLPLLTKKGNKNELDRFIRSLINYCDERVTVFPQQTDFASWLYARSYWMNDHPVKPSLTNYIDSMANDLLKKTQYAGMGRSAMLISGILRMAPTEGPLLQKAMAQLESIRQQAISDANGIRWKALADTDDLTSMGEEWLIKIAEAFEESGEGKATIAGIINWLLGAKRDHNWSTTKTTGDAVSLLNRNNVFSRDTINQVSLDAGSFRLTVTDDPLNGSLFGFHNLYGGSFPDRLQVTATLPKELKGVLNYYYFTEHPALIKNAPVLKKRLSSYNSLTRQWKAISEKDILHIGDKVKVELTIETSRRLSYVFIDDKRAAAFEPLEALSGYQYDDGMYYYRSVADEGFRFFADEIPSGSSTIRYEMIVAKEGVFSNGITVLQCMYQPAVKAYSGNFVVNVKAGE